MLRIIIFAFMAITCVMFAGEVEEKLRKIARDDYWDTSSLRPEITRQTLIQSIEMARAYYLNHQNQEGNFIYALDIANGDIIEKDNQVRQAGALWGLSSLNRDRFNEPTRRAVLLGINFYSSTVTTIATGEKVFVYKEDEHVETGAVALYCLALIEFLRGQSKYLDEKTRKNYLDILNIHLEYLQSQEQKDGSWARATNVETAFRDTSSSPYFDGEALLAYCKAARYFDRKDLLERVDYALPLLAKKYTYEAWKSNKESDMTKGFCQWGSMAAAEYVEAGFEKHRELAANMSFALSKWLLYINQVESKTGNTGYAVEGLLGSYRIAKVLGDEQAQKLFKDASLRIMSNLMTWQYKGPFMKFNSNLATLKTPVKGADGGITMTRNSTLVRIDVVQHQLHAMLMMLEHLFPENK